ncbi:MAG: fasciclin domain-containing protein [Microthrixaceae bacterium]
MSHTTPTRRRTMSVVVGILAVGSLVLGACSDDETTSGSDDTEQSTTTAEETTTTMADDMDDTESMALEPSGAACQSVPADGAGSFSGMAQDPAATAASNNPALSTLVTAVTEADLVDTLNGEGPFTIFAPANAAFEAIPADTLNAVLADQAALTDILTYHVIAGEMMSSQDLIDAGSAETVQGGELTFTDEGGSLMVNDSATGVCIDVPTANATVHIIDTVLMPSE